MPRTINIERTAEVLMNLGLMEATAYRIAQAFEVIWAGVSKLDESQLKQPVLDLTIREAATLYGACNPGYCYDFRIKSEKGGRYSSSEPHD